jgi:hypothetical protein
VSGEKIAGSCSTPQPLYLEAGGEGVAEVAGSHDRRAVNRFQLFPSPPMGERVRVRGK